MIEIDGSRGEGGGQILRTALALSAITKKECRISNIRKGREKPGLAQQHLLGAQVLSLLCQGKLEGDFLGSEELRFFPGKIKNGRQSFNIKVPAAGSITLLLQGLLPFCLLNESQIILDIEGGATDTFFSPTIDYFNYCFLKFLKKLGGKIEIEILKNKSASQVIYKSPKYQRYYNSIIRLSKKEQDKLKELLIKEWKL